MPICEYGKCLIYCPEPLLGYTLKNWNIFKLDELRKKRLIFYCNTSWPQYKLGNRETCPENGSTNYNTLQLDLFFRRKGKWLEFPYVQAFIMLTKTLSLCKNPLQSCVVGASPDILDDDLLSSPSVPQEGPKPPVGSIVESASPGTPTLGSGSSSGYTGPCYSPLYPGLPKEEEPSLAKVTWSGPSYLSPAPKRLPFRDRGQWDRGYYMHPCPFLCYWPKTMQGKTWMLFRGPCPFYLKLPVFDFGLWFSLEGHIHYISSLLHPRRETVLLGCSMATCWPITCPKYPKLGTCGYSFSRPGSLLGL